MISKKLLRACPVCGTSSGRVLHSQKFALAEGSPLPGETDYVTCDNCGFCFADTAAGQSTYDLYYAEMSKYADSATSTGSGLSPWDASRLTQLANQVTSFAPLRTSRLLDVGCATGGLLSALRDIGYSNICGIDPSPACVEAAHDVRAGDVWTGTLSDLPEDIGTFDGILLSHVMEHVRDLSSAMLRLREKLKPGGWIYIEVPDASRYADFLVAPFQDFNTEHINHFSSAGLANLCRACGFAPELEGTKDIFSAKDVPYPAVFCFARVSDLPQEIVRDYELPLALTKYADLSRTMMDLIDRQIRDHLTRHPSIIVWGVGQLTMKLLSDTCLGEAQIEAFVDGNPINHGKTLHGHTIRRGSDLVSSRTPILVCSLINSEAIAASILDIGFTNPILTLTQKDS